MADVPLPFRQAHRRRRVIGWTLVILMPVVLAGLWLSGLVGLALMWWALRDIDPALQERGLWLDHYRVGIEARLIEGLSDNVSGLTFSPETGTLFTVINRPNELAELSRDGQLLRRIPLESARDVEGITHVAGNRFIVIDEGAHRLAWIEVAADTQVIDLAAAPFLTLDLGAFHNMGFEGISWDQSSGTLVMVQEMWPVRVMMVTGLDEAVQGKGLGVSVREWRPAGAAGHAVADLSSVTLHDATGNLLLLSHLTSVLAEYAPDGSPVSLMPLWRGSHGLTRGIPQAEGVAIGPDGAIYIVSEPNLFYRLERDHPARWMTAAAPR